MIVVTGGAGFIGSCFLWKLNRMGVTDILVVDQLDNSEKWKNLLGKKFLDYMQKDDFLRALSEINNITAIVHMGAESSTQKTDGDLYIRDNFEYSKTLAEYATGRGIPFIYASSAATYGDGESGYNDDESALNDLRPLNMYGYSKQMFDLWLQNTGRLGKVCGLKFFNVFGPNEYHKGNMVGVICNAFDDVATRGVMKLFKSYRAEYPDGGQMRDFVYVKDIVEAMWWLLSNPRVTGIYNLGTGVARSWNDIANAMFAAVGKKPNIEYIDMPEHLKPKYQYFTQANMDKLRAAGFDHKFMTLEESVADYSEYLKTKDYL
ncbi:MAG: ADP-glyceromanno-heptose 6-epimerase [Alphaproteobacteria bacterium]|nr:ADP-glyceromanno-heptose 6-epimerase [Alphaproteobacteria bacterium]